MIKTLTCLFLILSVFCKHICAQDQARSQHHVAVKKGEVKVASVSDMPLPAGPVKEMPPQGPGNEIPRKKHFVFPKRAEVNYSAITRDFAPSLMIREMPRQGASKMVQYPDVYGNTVQRSAASKNLLPPLIKGQSFQGNGFSVATPNDNDMAISDSGMVISVINTNILVYNSLTKKPTTTKSLFAFTEPVNDNDHVFDPKVIYDPDWDRFVLVCLAGSVDSTSKVILGFSQTNDPAQGWNLYELPGDALQNNLWSDYPMMALSEKELFLTVNLLYNDSSWQTGFVETLIWQMDKENGYTGKSLNSVLHNNIKWQGKPVRNLCPVKGGSRLYGPDMYFISNRNLASVNDTVFIVNLSDVIGSANSAISVKASRTNLPYRFPPDGVQKGTVNVLATNDCRNLGAFFENDKIQYVHNTKNLQNNRPTVQYGVIHNPETPAPNITGYLIESDSLDFGYPNISYAGLDADDNSAIVTFNHSSDSVYAGCSAVLADGWGLFSPVKKVQDGAHYIDLLNSTLERWGDYSGSQRRYNRPGEVWMSGYYGYKSGGYLAHGAWIAQLETEQARFVGVKKQESRTESAQVFPNPAADQFSVQLSLDEPEHLRFYLLDVKGSVIATLMKDWVTTRENTFSFNTRDLEQGIYFLKVSGNKGTNITKKVVIK